MLADAITRPLTECKKLGIFISISSIQETLRDKFVRLFPQGRMRLQDMGAHREHVTF